MTMTITIHGIGDGRPDYVNDWKVAEILKLPAGLVKGFYYEDLLDADKLGYWIRTAATLLARFYAPRLQSLVKRPVDYLQDIFVFFLCADTRQAIHDRLHKEVREALVQYGHVRLIGHSLGSIIAYWFLLENPGLARRVELVTLGSPLGSPTLEGLVKTYLDRITRPELGRPLVRDWYNVHSLLDPISGEIVRLGCRMEDQVGLGWASKTLHHEVDEYLRAYAFYYQPDAKPAA